MSADARVPPVVTLKRRTKGRCYFLLVFITKTKRKRRKDIYEHTSRFLLPPFSFAKPRLQDPPSHRVWSLRLRRRRTGVELQGTSSTRVE